MYKTILIPLENSAADQAILDHIRPLAKLMDSRLILVHVADGFAARNQDQLNLEDSEEIVGDRAYLEQRSGELAKEGFEVKWRLARGNPAGEILSVAEAEACDLIAMSTHGHRMLKDLLLGSVASELRHRTHIPVLMIRSPTT
jgi:nucleotide-binding universal stress UspA family protein